MNQRIKESIRQSIELKQAIFNDQELLETINDIVGIIISSYENGGKVLFCGNGGSAADAQHLAAELSGRFYFDRPPLYAEALHVNTSYVTAVANDYSYNSIYSRLIDAMGQKNDILIGLSTSGNSPNVIEAFKKASEKGMITIAFTGESGGKLKEISNFLINVPSKDTPRIQESHIMIGHIICELIEKEIFKK